MHPPYSVRRTLVFSAVCIGVAAGMFLLSAVMAFNGNAPLLFRVMLTVAGVACGLAMLFFGVLNLFLVVYDRLRDRAPKKQAGQR